MKLKSGFFTLTIIVFMCMSVVFSDRIRLDFRTSLERCLFIVVPSLYIFMILSCMLVSSGTCRLLGIPFRKFSENVLHIPSELFGIFVISLVGGYPTGAKLLCSMAENNQISYEDADMFLFRTCVYLRSSRKCSLRQCENRYNCLHVHTAWEYPFRNCNRTFPKHKKKSNLQDGFKNMLQCRNPHKFRVFFRKIGY